MARPRNPGSEGTPRPGTAEAWVRRIPAARSMPKPALSAGFELQGLVDVVRTMAVDA